MEETFFKLAVNNEIIASSVTNKVGSSLPYFHCLEYLIEKKKEQIYPATLHTDHCALAFPTISRNRQIVMITFVLILLLD